MVELHKLSTPDAVISWYGNWTFLVLSRLLIKMSNETLARAALNVINLSQNVEVAIVGVNNQTISFLPGLWKPCCLADAKTAPRNSHKLTYSTHPQSLAFIIDSLAFQVAFAPFTPPSWASWLHDCYQGYQNNKMTHRQRLYLWDCKMRQCVVKHATFTFSADHSSRISRTIKIDVPHRPHLFNPIHNLYRAIGLTKFLDTFVLKNLFSLWLRINSSSCYWAIWAPSHDPSPHRYSLPRKIRLPAPYKNVWRKLKIISIAI